MTSNFDLNQFREGRSREALNTKKRPSKRKLERKYPVRTYLTWEERENLDVFVDEDGSNRSLFLRRALEKAGYI